MVSQPNNGEQALEITETLVRSNAVDAIVVDSVAALVPRAEIEGEMGDIREKESCSSNLMTKCASQLHVAINYNSCLLPLKRV